MKTIILLSHQLHLAQALKQYLIAMVGAENAFVQIKALGGIGDQLGTDAQVLLDLIKNETASEQFYLFVDLGSAVLSAEAAVLLLDQTNVHIIKTSFVENAYATYVLCWNNVDHETILAAAQQLMVK